MSLFQERYKLYYKQMLTPHHMNKEVCFHYFVHPLYIGLHVTYVLFLSDFNET